MYTFRKAAPARSVMFLVSYDDARTAYLWVDNPVQAGDTRAVDLIVRWRVAIRSGRRAVRTRSHAAMLQPSAVCRVECG